MNMGSVLKYIAYGVLVGMVFALGYQAGDQGIRAARLQPEQPSQRLFRPFSSFDFSPSVEPTVTAEAADEALPAGEIPFVASEVSQTPPPQKQKPMRYLLRLKTYPRNI